MDPSIALLVRRADPDRYLASLFAPHDKRDHLLALFAFNIELARVAETVRQPMMGEIRLEWWQETLTGARAGKPRNHVVARALAELFGAIALPREPFDQMISARRFDSTADTFADRAALEAYCDATSGNLMRLAALVLGHCDGGLAQAAGTGYAITGLLRAIGFHGARHKLYVPTNLLAGVDLTPDLVFARQRPLQLKAVMAQMRLWALAHWTTARAIRLPEKAVAAYLPAALIPLYLRRIERGSNDPYREPTTVFVHRRQITLLLAALRRRL